MSSVIEDVTERALSSLGERAAAAAKEMLGPDAAETVERVTHHTVRRVQHEADRAADVVDGTALCIRRQPLKAVAISFAGGLVMGALAASALAALRRG